MPKARSTVKPLRILRDASSEEQAHARGLHEGMLRKVNRIKQEVATREAVARKLAPGIAGAIDMLLNYDEDGRPRELAERPVGHTSNAGTHGR